MTVHVLDAEAGAEPLAIAFRVPGIPISQGSMTSYAKGVTVDTHAKQLKPWRDRIHAVASGAMRGAEPTALPVITTVMFTLPRPKSVHRSLPVGRREGDLDKLVRAVHDAMTRRDDGFVTGVYVDDCQVVHTTMSKGYVGAPGHMTEPGVEVQVREVRP